MVRTVSSDVLLTSFRLYSCSICVLVLPSIKDGMKFGDEGGSSFDDSLLGDFTHSHYLRGLVTQHDTSFLEWCQFLYALPGDSENLLLSDTHGTRPTTDVIHRFCLAENERISKVQVIVGDEIMYVGDIETSVELVRGVRFFTTHGQASQPINHIQGKLHTEQFHGYVVKYISGRRGLFVDQLQFHWYPYTTN